MGHSSLLQPHFVVCSANTQLCIQYKQTQIWLILQTSCTHKHTDNTHRFLLLLNDPHAHLDLWHSSRLPTMHYCMGNRDDGRGWDVAACHLSLSNVVEHKFLLAGQDSWLLKRHPVSETMLIKQWGEKSKRPSLSTLWGSILLQPALTKSRDWAEMETQLKVPWPIFVVDYTMILASDLIEKAYLSALKQPSQHFKSCRTIKKKKHVKITVYSYHHKSCRDKKRYGWR